MSKKISFMLTDEQLEKMDNLRIFVRFESLTDEELAKKLLEVGLEAEGVSEAAFAYRVARELPGADQHVVRLIANGCKRNLEKERAEAGATGEAARA